VNVSAAVVRAVTSPFSKDEARRGGSKITLKTLAQGAAGALRRCDLYLQHSIALEQAGAHANDVAGDSRSLLVAFADGACQLFSWQGQLRGLAKPLAALADGGGRGAPLGARLSSRAASAELAGGYRAGGGARAGLAAAARSSGGAAAAARSGSPPRATGLGGHATAMRAGSLGGTAPPLGALGRRSSSSKEAGGGGDACIEAVDYAPGVRALALVLADGRCALCRAADGGLAPVEQLAFTRWVCGPGSGALCVRIGAAPPPPRPPHAPLTAARCLRACRRASPPYLPWAQAISLQLLPRRPAARSPGRPAGRRGRRRNGVRAGAGARAQLVAVGLATGEVALYRLWAAKAGDPLRVISLADWGYEPEATGSVADLQCAPPRGRLRGPLRQMRHCTARLLKAPRRAPRLGPWRCGTALHRCEGNRWGAPCLTGSQARGAASTPPLPEPPAPVLPALVPRKGRIERPRVILTLCRAARPPGGRPTTARWRSAGAAAAWACGRPAAAAWCARCGRPARPRARRAQGRRSPPRGPRSRCRSSPAWLRWPGAAPVRRPAPCPVDVQSRPPTAAPCSQPHRRTAPPCGRASPLEQGVPLRARSE